MRECSVHEERINAAIRTLDQGQPLTRRENVELLEGLGALCIRLRGDTQLRMWATERLAEQFAERLAEQHMIATAPKAPAPKTWLGRVLLAALS
jgi:hypothetical protein